MCEVARVFDAQERQEHLRTLQPIKLCLPGIIAVMINFNSNYLPGYNSSRCLCIAALFSAAWLSAKAQPAPVVSGQDVVRLPVFSVVDERSSAYGAKEAVSTTRVSVPIQDVPQTVSVVTRELFDDTMGSRMLDVAKYVTPVMESSLSSGGDRVSLRGFQVSQRFIDGVNISGVDGYNMASDTTNIERLEIIKGPNAILVPGGSPGGIMNQITKSPKFKNDTSLSLIFKEYLTREASLDVNRVFAGGKSAARLVVSGWNADGYFANQYRQGWLIAPSFTHIFGADTQFTSKVEMLYNRETQGVGTVIDPSVGTDGYAFVQKGMPRNNSWVPDTDNRERRELRWTNELDFRLGESVSARLWMMYDHAERDDQGAPGGVPAVGYQGNRDPRTGKWVPLTSFGAAPTYSPTPIVRNDSLVFNRTGQANLIIFDEVHLKNDYAWERELTDSASNTLIAGISANYQRLSWKNWSNTRAPIDYTLGAPVYNTPILSSRLLRDKQAAQQDAQIFVYDRLNLLDDHLILAGGISQFWGTLERLDDGTLPSVVARSITNSLTDANLGLIYKPTNAVSLFAGYNKVGGALPSSILAGEQPKSFKVQTGDQLEAGVKSSFKDGRYTMALSWFDIALDNFQVPNSAFVTDPTQPQFLFQDLTSKGIEFEVNFMLTKELLLVGNFTHLRMRDPNGVRQRMVPDNAGALFAKYEFADGSLKNFGISLGVDYMDKAPGEQASGITAASTGTQTIPNQPSFYLAPRTIYTLGFSYKQPTWSVRLNIENVFDKDYIQSAGSRNSLVPGLPRTYAFSATYKF